MASYTITIPDAILAKFVQNSCKAKGYQAEVPNPADPTEMIPNPETKAQFTKRMFLQYIRNLHVRGDVRTYEEGVDAVKSAAEAEADGITIT